MAETNTAKTLLNQYLKLQKTFGNIMGDLIELLTVISKLNTSGLIIDSQVEYIATELSDRLSKILTEESAELLNNMLCLLNNKGTINIIN